MYKDPNLHSMQLTVPQSVYGECTYFAPKPISEWLYGNGCEQWGYVGSSAWGNGYTDGVSNATSNYMVYNIHPEDATAFRIQFPQVKVHLGKQYDYSKI
jgi:hypothetical protein